MSLLRENPAGRLSRLTVSLLFLLALPGLALGAVGAIVEHGQAHVGEEVVLSAGSLPSDWTLEWAVSGNVRPILLRNGGRECAFTPVDTQPIAVSMTVRDRNGASQGVSELTLTPREFDITLSAAGEEPLSLWDPIGRKDVPTDALMAGRPIHLRASLNPPFTGAHTFVWGADPSTLLSQGKDTASHSDVVIQRGETGDCEISVTAYNAAGVRLGSVERAVSVALSQAAFEESERSRGAWRDWQGAEAAWEAGNYAQAMELGQRAHASAPRDPDIAGGLRSMSANYDRFRRGQALRDKAEEERGKKLYDEALKDLRQAQVAWPTEEGEALVRRTEAEATEYQSLLQKAQWLRDTATAYDQEGIYDDALKYYAQAIALVSSDAVQDRMERIQSRLGLIAEADRYAAQGAALEKEGRLKDAIELYSASLEKNSDPALREHMRELQRYVTGREKRAASLYTEGMNLERRSKFADALQRYRESQRLWETPGAQDRIEELEKIVSSDAPVRGPENFGLVLQSDVEKVIRSADDLYLRGRLEEAAVQYRRALAMSSNDELRTWLEQLEAVIRDRKAVRAANAKIQEGNALRRAGKLKEALAKYQESLKLHSNAEVEAFLKDQLGE